jgi:hypothetical protein
MAVESFLGIECRSACVDGVAADGYRREGYILAT